MSAPPDCREIVCWQELFGDTVPPDQWERCERHLESCPACQKRLHQAEGLGNAQRSLGRQFGDPTCEPPDPTLTQVLEQLYGAGSPGPTTSPEPLDLYFLRPAERPDLLGTLGAYEVRGVIGQGGMGVVLKAFEPALHRLVAIKVLAPLLAGSATARLRFTREAQAAAAVSHDHIVAVHGVHEADGLPYLVMQYVLGESLQERLDRTGPLEVEEVVRIGHQTAAGLAAAHAQGLIHRDVKPANLLLENGLAKVKITDFGLARTADDVQLTQAGVVAGTPEYMAPEQARGEQVDPRADLFSLGSVLYACCTGLPPFRGPTALAVLHRVSDQKPAPIRSLNPDVPAWLEALIDRLLAKDPAGRFQGAGEVAALLEGYLAHLRQPATVPAPELPPAPAAGAPRRSEPGVRTGVARWLPPCLGLAALLLLAGLGLALGLAGVGDGTDSGKGYQHEYYQSFKDNPKNGQDFELLGPDADQCVKFEPAGLRITLPAGYPGERPGTGLLAPVRVRGDFEVTVHFEILQEPEPADTAIQTRFNLSVVLDTPQWNVASITRHVAPKGGPQFSSWESLWNEASGKNQQRRNTFPTQARTGRLRLVRTGDVLSYHAAEGPGADFHFLQQYPFGMEDVKDVRLVGSTGGPRAAFDVRATDLRIRADSLPNQPDRPAAVAPGSDSKPWLTAAKVLGLVVALVSLTVLGVWLAVRQRRRGGSAPAGAAVPDKPAGAQAAAPPASLPCPGCGKGLKVRAELAGKKVKCPACGRAVAVPGAEAGGTRPTPAGPRDASSPG